MKIILANGQELPLLMVTGGSRQIQGANRDCLSFVFDNIISLDELDKIFTESNCEIIKITGDDDNTNAIYLDYTVRAELKKYNEVAAKETPNNKAVIVERVIISMAQLTYQEKQMKLLEARLANLEG